MKVREVTAYLETIAPRQLQESYDNSGLIVGDPNAEITGVLVSLDAIESIVDEAIEKKCNLVVSHHPILFRGLKSLTGKDYVERTLLKAIKNDIALYAIHTNLDNVLHNGVNGKIAERLGLVNKTILSPKKNLHQVHLFFPSNLLSEVENVLNALPMEDLGGEFLEIKVDKTAEQCKIGLKCPEALLPYLQASLHFFGTQVQMTTSILSDYNAKNGSGMVGELPNAMDEKSFLKLVKEKMGAGCIRHTQLLGKSIHKVALCGGAGSFLLPRAKASGAQVFITGDYKYHEFFDAEKSILIADIGHYESEQFTIELLAELISEKFSTFALYCTEVTTNPVYYL